MASAFIIDIATASGIENHSVLHLPQNRNSSSQLFIEHFCAHLASQNFALPWVTYADIVADYGPQVRLRSSLDCWRRPPAFQY